ncbi:MAG: glycosyltransferase family 4 protein [Halobacteriovoraceae bacterium]|nr:glycosyltransferase family 4 protein [Halobacteriovoraceae bacterium]
MNVLMLTLRSDMGGGPKHLLQLAQSIKKDAPHIRIFSASPLDPPFGEELKKLSFQHIELEHRTFRLKYLIKILKLCKQYNISTVHSHGRGAGVYSRPCKFLGINVIHTFHGIHQENNLIGLMKHFLDIFLKSLTDKFICVSDDEHKEALRANMCDKKSVVVIRNGIDVAEYNTEYKINRERLVLGTLARFNFQKGLDILIDYIGQYKHDYPHTRFEFLLAGDGELRIKLEEKISLKNLNDSIKLLGVMEPTAFLNSLTIYISFARWEGLPLSVLEAMAMRRPCLLSNVTGHTQFAKNSSVELFNLDQYDEFKNKLTNLINSEDILQKLSSNGRKLIEDEYSLKKMVEYTIKLYK